MQVRVVYLGMLRDVAGRGHEVVSLAEGSRLGDLYDNLEGRFPKLQGFRNSLALALNQDSTISAPSCTTRTKSRCFLLSAAAQTTIRPPKLPYC